MLTQITIQQSVDEYAEIQNALKSLPVIKKPIDHAPKLLPRETVSRQIESFLMNDNRDFGLCRFEDKIGGLEASESLLPAEGTLFLTNYRLIFHGTSLEHENRIIVRSIPVASIIKVKNFTAHSELPDSSISNLQIRAAPAEFLHVIFNSAVSEDEKDRFTKSLNVARFPPDHSPLSIFAFANASSKTINKDRMHN